MAVIAMFYEIIISMYYFDHQRHQAPHIYVRYQEQELLFQFQMVKFWKENLRETR